MKHNIIYKQKKQLYRPQKLHTNECLLKEDLKISLSLCVYKSHTVQRINYYEKCAYSFDHFLEDFYPLFLSMSRTIFFLLRSRIGFGFALLRVCVSYVEDEQIICLLILFLSMSRAFFLIA